MSAGRPAVVAVLPFKEGFAPSAAGAVGLVLRDILRATADGCDTTVIGRAAGGTPFPFCRFVAAPVPAPLRWLLGNNRAYALMVRRALRGLRADVIEVHNRPDMALALARGGARVALVLHNDPQGMRGAQRAAERAHLLRRLAGIVCVSDWLRGRFLDGVADTALHARAHVIPNGIDLDAVHPAEKRYPVLLFVGRITADKGFDSFVRACALALPQLRGWRAEAIGGDRFRPDSPETDFIRRIRPEAEAARVRMIGFQENAAALAAMASAAILVMPSRWDEPFGRVAQEAHLAGAALVASRRGGLPEAAGEAALYVDPDDPAAIAEAILRLARDPALAARLRADGARHVRRFGLAETGARWTALRRSLLA